jgi:hypothetical protein
VRGCMRVRVRVHVCVRALSKNSAVCTCVTSGCVHGREPTSRSAARFISSSTMHGVKLRSPMAACAQASAGLGSATSGAQASCISN